MTTVVYRILNWTVAGPFAGRQQSAVDLVAQRASASAMQLATVVAR